MNEPLRDEVPYWDDEPPLEDAEAPPYDYDIPPHPHKQAPPYHDDEPPPYEETPPTVSRWSKHGKDRLYVQRAGQTLGYWDLTAQRVYPEHPDYAPTVSEAAMQWCALAGIEFPEAPRRQLPGDLLPAPNLDTIYDRDVRSALRAAGYNVPDQKMALVVARPTDGSQTLLVPDIVLLDHQIAVEVDPCGDRQGYYSHSGDEERDADRNRLIEAQGWTVIRFRLGAQEGDAIGARDVLVEAKNSSQKALASLLDAVADAVNGVTPRIRRVSKRPANRKQHILDMKHRGSQTTFRWYPELGNDVEFVRLTLVKCGKYLYREERFIAQVDLDTVPADEWQEWLVTFLQDRDEFSVEGCQQWPWGDLLLVPEHDDAKALVDACATQASMLKERCALIVESKSPFLLSEDGNAVLNSAAAVVATLHPAARAHGWRLDRTGPRGTGTEQLVVLTHDLRALG